jgi:hypothetical protein
MHARLAGNPEEPAMYVADHLSVDALQDLGVLAARLPD